MPRTRLHCISPTIALLAMLAWVVVADTKKSTADTETLVPATSVRHDLIQKDAASRVYVSEVRPLLSQYCTGCHSAAKHKGDLDLERFDSVEQIRRDIKPWESMLELVEAGEMPPAKKKQPTDAERTKLVSWLREMLHAEAVARAGDPGDVPLRRLSNAEYDNTIFALTGVDLHPAEQFPADGAAGEGFTNAAEALAEMSPTLLEKYLAAAKSISGQMVLLPDGIRFSAGKARRDWTNESVESLRAFYRQYSDDGRLPLRPYLDVMLRRRAELIGGKISTDGLADAEHLNRRFLKHFWRALSTTSDPPTYPLGIIRASFALAGPSDADAIAREISAWQQSVWTVAHVGSYMNETRQQPAGLSPRIAALAQHAGAGIRMIGGSRGLVRDDSDEFRRLFPLYICFPNVIPTDEVVCLKQFHREDEPLKALFLDEGQVRRLDRLWDELEFISQRPLTENKYLPLFIGFTTQDAPKGVTEFFEAKRGPFEQRAQAFIATMKEAVAAQQNALLDFAARAFRRPLSNDEKARLLATFTSLKNRGQPDEDALRGMLCRILVSPAFLFKVEQAPSGKEPGRISDWELATRLSYFLWSSMPDASLRQAAEAGNLHEPAVLEAQARRMLANPRVRELAIEFGDQWIHVRGFDQFNEKNERLFPNFSPSLRAAMNDESTLLFQDVFQRDEPVTDILAADYTYLSQELAAHYGIPGVSGPAMRRADGVHRYGRGGVLTLGAVLSKQAAASRTSPVLRGNWVVETLLGEKLPRPPADVPKIAEAEGDGGMTMRQIVEKHTSDPSCNVCHQRIDPMGFTFELYDSIGRRRDRESSGLPIDCRANLKDGTPLDGIDGLRDYLLSKKKEVVLRLICRRLLGYALGRSVTLADQPTLDQMMADLKSGDGKMSTVVLDIVRSKQFQYIRGAAASDEVE